MWNGFTQAWKALQSNNAFNDKSVNFYLVYVTCVLHCFYGMNLLWRLFSLWPSFHFLSFLKPCRSTDSYTFFIIEWEKIKDFTKCQMNKRTCLNQVIIQNVISSFMYTWICQTIEIKFLWSTYLDTWGGGGIKYKQCKTAEKEAKPHNSHKHLLQISYLLNFILLVNSATLLCLTDWGHSVHQLNLAWGWL